MKPLIVLILLTVFTLTSHAGNSKKVAMLISGYGSQNSALSYDLEELAQAYLVLSDNGVDIDIISPHGGAVLVKNNKDNLAFIQRFKKLANQKLGNTLSAEQALSNQYQGLFIIGGDGAMFDLPTDKSTQHFISKFVFADKTIAAVCHGPAALVNIKLENGAPFLSGRQVNSFTLVEDKAFKKETVAQYPFVLQNKLEQIGANFIHNSPMLPFISVDRQLITAQNPMSVGKAAEALLIKLGVTPKPRILFKDEATLHLVAQAKTNGAYLIDIAMTKSPESYDLNYLALYGFYAYPLATTNIEKKQILRLKARIAKYFAHPQYYQSLIAAHLDQKEVVQANETYKKLTNEFPEFQLADELKEKLDL